MTLDPPHDVPECLRTHSHEDGLAASRFADAGYETLGLGGVIEEPICAAEQCSRNQDRLGLASMSKDPDRRETVADCADQPEGVLFTGERDRHQGDHRS